MGQELFKLLLDFFRLSRSENSFKVKACPATISKTGKSDVIYKITTKSLIDNKLKWFVVQGWYLKLISVADYCFNFKLKIILICFTKIKTTS